MENLLQSMALKHVNSYLCIILTKNHLKPKVDSKSALLEKRTFFTAH